VKETLTGKKQGTDKTGGMGDLFPSKDEKDNKPKEKAGGGIFGGLLSTEKPGENSSGGAISAGGSNAESNSGADSSKFSYPSYQNKMMTVNILYTYTHREKRSNF